MGVMPDTVKVIAVFVIAGVGAFDEEQEDEEA
mgnify:CR=1 FL=1